MDDQGNVFQGGVFQAKTLTSAMVKTRQGVQSLGRLLFAHRTELINPATNNGLPPNPTLDPPSQSFIMKGVDVMSASLTSELGFLTNPIGSRVPTAEMGNQALDSLALISARYTHIAADILSRLCAADSLVVCQALDLRAFETAFIFAVESPIRDLVIEIWEDYALVDELHILLWSSLKASLADSMSQDPKARFDSVASSSSQSWLLPTTSGLALGQVGEWPRPHCDGPLLNGHFED